MKHEIKSIFDKIKAHGGKAYFVGGCVRDTLLGKEPKDFDIEVFGLTFPNLESVLADFGEIELVGKSFGVIKLRLDGVDIDISLPRKDRKTGVLHKDFEISVDPTMLRSEACSRRDFTINAMMMNDVGTVFDFFDGRKDLVDKILRHTSPFFSEDPLRPLRAVQFAGRFGMTLAEETRKVCEAMLPDAAFLPTDRICGEFRKWTTSVAPSCGLAVLEQTKWISLFPEVQALVGLDQDPEWHPEGDAWVHTIRTTDMAAKIADRDGLQGEDREVLLLAALCHDLGKPLTTEFVDGRLRSRRHAKEGEVPTRSFLARIGAPNRIVDRVVPLVVEHMIFVNNEFRDTVIRRLAVRLHPETIPMLVRVIEADHGSKAGEPWKSTETVLEIARRVQVEMSKPKPILMGRHLLELGVKPGPEMGKILKASFEAQLDGEFDSLEGALAHVRRITTDCK